MRKEEIIGVAFAAALVAHVALFLAVAGREIAASPEAAASALGAVPDTGGLSAEPIRIGLGVAAREPVPPRPLVPVLPVGSFMASPGIGEGWPDGVDALAVSGFVPEPPPPAAASRQHGIDSTIAASAIRFDIAPVRRELPGEFKPRPSLARAAEGIRADPSPPEHPPHPQVQAPGIEPPAMATALPHPEVRLFTPTR